MRKRDLELDIQFSDMLLDDNDKVKNNVDIECMMCEGRDFKVDSFGGTVLQCIKCENAIGISFVKNDEQKINGVEFKVGDIVECEAFRDVVVLRNGIMTTERNKDNQPLRVHKNLKVIGNIKDNSELAKKLTTKNNYGK